MSTQNQNDNIPILTHAKPSQVRSILVKNIKAKLVSMIHGSPGIGKSQIVHGIGKEFNLKVIDLRLSQCDPTDLNGFPQLINGRATYTPFDTFPIEGTPLPTKYDDKGQAAGHYDGWILFLDELTSAPRAVQAAAYKLVLDHMVGNHKLHAKVAIIAAGNLETDNAIVEEMSTALQSRMAHIQMVIDEKEWVDHASSQNVDYRIGAYIGYKPSMLYTFSPDHTDHTYACPRTWFMADSIIKTSDNDIADSDFITRMAGVISDGVAREFVQFCGVASQLPSIAKIIAEPKSVAVPTELSVLFLLCGALASQATPGNIDPIIAYISRLPVEFQVVALRDMIRRKKELLGHPSMTAWIEASAKNLF